MTTASYHRIGRFARLGAQGRLLGGAGGVRTPRTVWIASFLGFAILALAATGCARPSVSQGRALYGANGCAGCHGPDGRGDGPLAKHLPAAPIDFRNVALFKRGATEDDIAQTLFDGVSMIHTVPALRQTHHVLLMPKFDHLSKIERRSIALYVISFRTNGNNGRDNP
jgi:mono/diheme cytochrome c family protein